MTDPLYLRDCYLREFSASVVSVDGKKVELDKTAFYPNSGGQPNDTGIISVGDTDFIVSDVVKDKGRIVHLIDRPGLNPGDKIKGQVDWTRRYIHMRYHTASHVLSGIIYNSTGAEITGNQISTEKTRIDFDLENFDRAKLPVFEQAANKILAENHPVLIRFLSREEAMKIPTVTKLAMGLPESVKEVRIVSVEGFGKEACGGTHLKNTEEAGQIEFLNVENKGKSNRRIYFRLKGEGNND